MKKILVIILILILPIVALAADLFSDGFESGDTSAWSAVATGGGDLSVAEGAKLHGTYGLSVFIDDTADKYVRDDTPTDEARYRCRFYFDPNGLTMTAGWNEFPIFWGSKTDWALSFQVSLQYNSGYFIRARSFNDSGDTGTSYYAITDAPHCIEVDWKASSGAGNNDGEIKLWIDGVLKETLSSIDNDTKSIGVGFLGATWLAAGFSGTFFLDDFASNDDGTEIGAYPSEDADNAVFFGMNF